MNIDERTGTEEKTYGKKTLVQASIAAFVALVIILLWKAGEVFLVIFAGILLAVFLHALSSWISQKTHLPERWSLAFLLLAFALATAAGIRYIAPDVSAQTDQLVDRIPKAVDHIQQQALKHKWIKELFEQKDQLKKMAPDGSTIASTTTGIFTLTFHALANFFIFLVIGIFLAINPGTYIHGLLQLIPKARRPRIKGVLQAVGSVLESWLLAKITSMFAVGILTTVGLSLIGIELALLLGILAAILTFIPNIGPLLSLIPAVLLALMHGADKIIYVISLYAGIQAIESYVLTPLLQKQMVDLPPAFVISMQVLLGVLAGGVGVILAPPLAATALVVVRMMYVEDILDDHQSEAC